MKKVISFLFFVISMVICFKVGQGYHMFTRMVTHEPLTVGTGSQALQTLSDHEVKTVITQTLNQQVSAWNRGDIDGFMTDYWTSNDLRFASGGTVKYGWQTTSDRYKARYPDKASMGTLAFTDLDIDILSPTDALVFGRWMLTREADTPNGLFTLHMRKDNGRWIIVSDHTSSSK